MTIGVNKSPLAGKEGTEFSHFLYAFLSQVTVYNVFKAYYHCVVTSSQSSYDICL